MLDTTYYYSGDCEGNLPVILCYSAPDADYRCRTHYSKRDASKIGYYECCNTAEGVMNQLKLDTTNKL